MDDTYKLAIERLRSTLQERKISPAQFARAMDVARQQTYRWLNGHQEMSRKYWEKAAILLDIHPANLMYDTDLPSINDERLVSVLENIHTIMEEKGVKLTPRQIAKCVTEGYKSDTNIEFLVELLSTT